MHFVYIIQSLSSGKWYYGYSSNPEKRLIEHNQGINPSTSNRGPWKLIFAKAFHSKTDALKFELLLKKYRKEGIHAISFLKYHLPVC